MLVCAAAFLGIGASAAGAATVGQSYGYAGEFGTPDSTVFAFNFFNAIAVSNDDGKVFIVRNLDPSLGGGAIDVLDPATGNSLFRTGTGGYLPGGVAVSADGSYMFIADSQGSIVRKFVRSGTAPLTYTEDTLWNLPLPGGPTGLVVDPTTGDLLLSVGKLINRYDAVSGALLSSIDGSTSGSGLFTRPGALAVAPDRDIYVGDGTGRVLRFAPDGSFKGRLLPDGQVIGIAVNPQSGDVAVETPGSGDNALDDAAIRIYSSANVLKDVIYVPAALAVPDAGGSNSNSNKGLAFSPDGSKLYVGLSDGSAHVYSPGTQPGVDAPLVSSVTPTGAHVSANVATGGDPTKAWIEYCLADDGEVESKGVVRTRSEVCERNLSSEGPSPWKRLSEQTGLSTNPGQDTIQDDLAGLEPNTKYLLRTYAINDGSKVENRSSTTAFATGIPAPLVTTGTASDLGETSAQLVGSVDNTFGDQTTFHFEYGLTTDYGSRIPTGADGVAGNLRTPRAFNRLATGLQPGTTYHFRLVATNSGGTTVGADQTFTTLGVDQLAPNRAYEQVTPVVKNGLALQVGYGVQAASDGSGFEYTTTTPSTDASSAALVQRYVAWRGPSDWSGAHPADPPYHRGSVIILSPTMGVSDDMRHALVVSNYALTPGATEGAGNIYVKDLEAGTYRFVGSSTEDRAFLSFTGTTRQDKFIAAAPDFHWIVFLSETRLLPGVPKQTMYEWTATGGLSVLSLLPDGSIPTGNVHLQGTTQVSNRLVSDDGDTVVFSLENGNDGVYRRSGGQTEEVSVGQSAGGPTGMQPAIADGMSSDGRYVFFHTSYQLTDDDTDAENPLDGGRSEYRYDSSNGELEYLGPQDGTADGLLDVPWIGRDGKTVYFNSNNELVVWREGQGVDVVAPVAVRGGSFGSPNGRYFAFQAPDRSIRLYDAEAGESTCLSCAAGTIAPGGLPDGDRNVSNRVPQVVTNDGHAYFTTDVALLKADRNASNDVYEYFEGRLTLISPGDADFNASLADISADGRDVFFTTAQGLVSQDTDGNYDIYDARIGGGFAGQNPPPPPGPCAGDACQGAGASPPAVGTPGSLGAKGSGNTKPRKVHCAKNKRKVSRHGKTRCVKKKTNHNKKRHAKHNRGTGR